MAARLASSAFPRTCGPYARWFKPALDRTAAAVFIVVLLLLMLAIALAVLVSIGRPVLFAQTRVGQHGRTFTMWKFRTMRPCRRVHQDRRRGRSETASIPDRRRGDRRRTHKHPHDPRLVKVGRFLRKWSLDELPQLYNVLRGDMSLVGPRPELPVLVDAYEPWQHARHLVKPGITGLWQVTDRGQDGVLMQERTAVDLRYLDDVSLAADLKLVLMTLPAALGSRKGV